MLTPTGFAPRGYMTKLKTPKQIIDALETIYDESVDALYRLQRYLHTGEPPAPEMRASGAFCYPELVINYDPEGHAADSRAFGKMSEAGTYSTTITQPGFYRRYLSEQLKPLLKDYDVEIEVRRSTSEIPYGYVWDQGQAAGLDEINPAELARWFPSPQLSDIGDEIADGELFEPYTDRPLALFDGPRTDFSLKRLQHYTGTPVEHFQRYLLFTNYHRYVDAFCDWGLEQLHNNSRYTQLSVAGNLVITPGTQNARDLIDTAPWRRFQMPAYHLTTEDGSGRL